jgi:hypothetical protein
MGNTMFSMEKKYFDPHANHFDKYASNLDILLDIDSKGRLTTSLYDKCDNFDFAIVNFTFLCSNIPPSTADGVYISKLIRYARASFAYENFSKRDKLLTKKLMLQGYYESRLNAFILQILWSL